jgi:hypothetical protein
MRRLSMPVEIPMSTVRSISQILTSDASPGVYAAQSPETFGMYVRHGNLHLTAANGEYHTVLGTNQVAQLIEELECALEDMYRGDA